MLAIRGLVCVLALGICLSAWPCYGKAQIRQWSTLPSGDPTPMATTTPNPSPMMLPTRTPAPKPLPVEPRIQAPSNGRAAFGLSFAYYGSSPGVFAKGAFGSYHLSDLLQVRTGVLAGNTPILVPTSANLYEYSSFIRVPVGLFAKFHCLYGGLQVAETWVNSYNHPSYAITSFEPILGLAFEPGPCHFALDVSYPPFDPAVPLVVTLSIGGRY